MDPRVKQVIDALAKQFEDAAAERQRTGAPCDTATDPKARASRPALTKPISVGTPTCGARS